MRVTVFASEKNPRASSFMGMLCFANQPVFSALIIGCAVQATPNPIFSSLRKPLLGAWEALSANDLSLGVLVFTSNLLLERRSSRIINAKSQPILSKHSGPDNRYLKTLSVGGLLAVTDSRDTEN